MRATTLLLNTSVTVAIALSTLGICLPLFWVAGRYGDISFLAAMAISFLFVILLGILVFRQWRRISKFVAWLISGACAFAVGLLTVAPNPLTHSIFLQGFARTTLAAAPLSTWENLGARIGDSADRNGHIPQAKLPVFVKNMYSEAFVYSTVTARNGDGNRTDLNPSVFVWWRTTGFAVGIYTGENQDLPTRLVASKRLSDAVCVVSFRDE